MCRGGVEDTRLEAKAKDTKIIRGQGQPFRGQTLSRPRTGMLEAKAKNQGHKRNCSPKKKKGLHKNFSSDLHKKTFSKKFSSAPQNFNNAKNSAVLDPRTGQFSRTWGLKAKAKAKDFKMCPRGRPRGQGRPWGLHLWLCGILNLLPHLLISYYISNFLFTNFYRLTAWRTIVDITEFHIDFSFVVYNDRWQPWHAKFKKISCFVSFQFSLLCLYIYHQQKFCL